VKSNSQMFSICLNRAFDLSLLYAASLNTRDSRSGCLLLSLPQVLIKQGRIEKS